MTTEVVGAQQCASRRFGAFVTTAFPPAEKHAAKKVELITFKAWMFLGGST